MWYVCQHASFFCSQVLVVLVEKGGLFAQHKVVYFVIGTRVGRQSQPCSVSHALAAQELAHAAVKPCSFGAPAAHTRVTSHVTCTGSSAAAGYHMVNHMMNHIIHHMINHLQPTAPNYTGGRGAAAAGGLHVRTVCRAVWHRPLAAAHHTEGSHHRASPAGLPGACCPTPYRHRCVSFLTGMTYVAAAKPKCGLPDDALQMLAPLDRCLRR